jgi:hypothetical protein
MQPGQYHNQPVVDWARQNIPGRLEIKPLFSSLVVKLLIYLLLFCVPAAFFAIALVAILLGVKDRTIVFGASFFGFILLIPCGIITLLGAYVRRGFAKSLDPEGVNGSLGRKFPWAKLSCVDHVTKRVRAGRVSHTVKDNQLELVFEGGKLIIPPLIHERAKIWELINGIPAEVRDDGVPRGNVPASAGNPIRTQEDIMRLLESRRAAHPEAG